MAQWFLRRFFKIVNLFSLFRSYLLLEIGGALHLNKLEFPSSGCGKRIFFKFVNVFSQFHYYLPLEKSEPFILINLNPLYTRMLCVKFGWNWPSSSGEGNENVKSLGQQRQTTDKFWSEKLSWAFGSGELKISSRDSP